MLSRRTFALTGAAWTLTGLRSGFAASSDSKLAAAATKEGALRIDTTSDQSGVEALLDAFRRLYPGIALQMRRTSSRELHTTFLKESGAGAVTADLLLSSAMDLQFKLVNDGFAQSYASPEKSHLPDWAVWKDQAYAVTAEPIVFAYNRSLMPAGEVPQSHADLADLLRRRLAEFRGRIATYDPERSGTGYLYYTQDLLLSGDTLDLAQAVGKAQPKFYVSGTEGMNQILSGESILAYNMVSSYILERQSLDRNIRIIFPSDYTLVMSRIAFITKHAQHPAASRLFLDFLLSEHGQSLLAGHFMQPIRIGVRMDGGAPSPDVLRPIHFGPSLLANLDEFRRQRVLREWRRAIES
jgi:iron(III) transport system substrate-binding protein